MKKSENKLFSVVIWGIEMKQWLKPFAPSAPFLYLLKTLENRF